MTTGIMFFMSSSGDRTPIAIIPFPAIAVPYAPPRSGRTCWREKMNDGEKKAQHVYQTMKYRKENANAVHTQQKSLAASAGHCGSPMLVGPRPPPRVETVCFPHDVST